MHKHLFRSVVFVLVLSLAGCADSEPDPVQEPKQHPLWQTQLDAMERAKEVEGMVIQQAEQRRRQIEEIERR